MPPFWWLLLWRINYSPGRAEREARNRQHGTDSMGTGTEAGSAEAGSTEPNRRKHIYPAADLNRAVPGRKLRA
jgi:hypothetical protein